MSQSPLAALQALHRTLQEAEQFIAGFEDDEAQQPPVTELLVRLRAQISYVEAPAKGFDALPLASYGPTREERCRWIAALDSLLRYAGAPGDWGYESKLGQIITRLIQVRAELADASTLPKEGGAA